MGICQKTPMFPKKNSRELLFFLFAYKKYPFIKNKEIYLENLEKMLNKSKLKDRYLKLHKYFLKNWSKQKLLNYNEYLDNKFYDTTNNFSESFNNAINKFINMNHPKLSIYVEKIKNYIKMKISEYYENSKNIKTKIINGEISKNEFIFEKI